MFLVRSDDVSKSKAVQVQFDESAGYTVRHDESCFRAMVAAPVIEEKSLGALKFSESLADAEATIGGVKGKVRRAVAREKGVRVLREFFLSGDGQLAGLRVSVENVGEEPVHLLNIVPFLAEGTDSVAVGGARMADWRVLRMSRQKNDVPGVFRPGVDDANLWDALFSSTDIPAGQGVSLRGGCSTGDHIAADPCMVFRNDKDESHPAMFLGVFGQIEHLSEVRLYPSAEGNRLGSLKVICEFDGVLMEKGDVRTTHWLLFYPWADEYGAMQRFAEMLAAEHNVPHPPAPSSSYCNWYFYGLTMTQEDLEEELANLKDNPVRFRVFVLDNGWMDNFGTWNASERFPKGMKLAADTIKAAGYVPGMWTAPFIMMKDSPMVEQHPELLARDCDGDLIPYSYQGPACVVMDPSSPYAPEYFKEFFGRLKGWGFTYHKFDFLRAIPNGKGIRFYDPKMTRAQAYRLGMKLIREALGEDSYILACGGLYEAGVGLVDGQRSGCDVVASWKWMNYREERHTAQISDKQNIFRNFFNRLWHTDPDALMIRLREERFRPDEIREHLTYGDYTDEEAFTQLVCQYLGGGNVTIAERFPDLQESRRALLRHLFPTVGAPAVPLDIGAPNCPTLFLTGLKSPCDSLADWWTLTVINWETEPVTREVKLPVDRLPKDVNKLAVLEFKEQNFVGLLSPDEALRVELPPHGTRVFRLTPWSGKTPVIVGTNQHITAGCELRNVKVAADRITGERVGETQYEAVISVAVPHKTGCRIVTHKVAANETAFEIPLTVS
jgi:hypothetical protein